MKKNIDALEKKVKDLGRKNQETEIIVWLGPDDERGTYQRHGPGGAIIEELTEEQWQERKKQWQADGDEVIEVEPEPIDILVLRTDEKEGTKS